MGSLLLSYSLSILFAFLALAVLGVGRRHRVLLLILMYGITFGGVRLFAGEVWEPFERDVLGSWPAASTLIALALLALFGGGRVLQPLIGGGLLFATLVAAGAATTAGLPESAGLRAAQAGHDTAVLALAGVALAGLIGSLRGRRLGRGAAIDWPDVAGWKTLRWVALGLLLLLVFVLTVLFALQARPLNLEVLPAVLVLPAEIIAAICVWRGLDAVAEALEALGRDRKSAPESVAESDLIKQSTGTEDDRLASGRAPGAGISPGRWWGWGGLFFVSGLALALVPLILQVVRDRGIGQTG